MKTIFRTGFRYRHSTSGDLDIEVVKVQFFDENRTKMKIRYLDKRTGNVRYFPGGNYNGTYNIEIRACDYGNWSKL